MIKALKHRFGLHRNYDTFNKYSVTVLSHKESSYIERLQNGHCGQEEWWPHQFAYLFLLLIRQFPSRAALAAGLLPFFFTHLLYAHWSESQSRGERKEKRRSWAENKGKWSREEKVEGGEGWLFSCGLLNMAAHQSSLISAVQQGKADFDEFVAEEE